MKQIIQDIVKELHSKIVELETRDRFRENQYQAQQKTNLMLVSRLRILELQ